MSGDISGAIHTRSGDFLGDATGVAAWAAIADCGVCRSSASDRLIQQRRSRAELARMRSIRDWEMWSLPRPLQAALLLQAAVATALAFVSVLSGSLASAASASAGSWALLGMLMTIGVVAERLAARTGEARMLDAADGTGGVSTGTTAVWLFAGVVLLPLHQVLVLALVLTLADDLRLRRSRPEHRPHPLYRLTFNVAQTMTASAAGVLTFDAIPASSPAHQLVAGVAAWLVMYVYTHVVLGLVLMLARGAPYRYPISVLWSVSVEWLALSCLGYLLALAWLSEPMLLLIGVPPVLLLQQALLHKQLREAAATDSKTGLTAAARWRELSEMALAKVQARSGSTGILVIDIDAFKAVNDTYGHLVGDDVLLAATGAMRAAVRTQDLVGRFGGEEFVVLLPDADETGVAAAADRIRLAIAAVEVRAEGWQQPLKVTASIGAACYPRDGYTLTELLEQADRAMYAAKHAGRNRVCFPADAEAPDTVPVAGALPPTHAPTAAGRRAGRP